MKKLTAGIFTVLMGLVSVNAADAAVASKGYVDSFVGENGSLTKTVENLNTTVTNNKNATDQAIADAKKAGTDAAAALETYKGENNQRVQAVEGEVDTLQSQVADETNGLIKKVGDLQTQIGNVADGNLTIKEDAITSKEIAGGAVNTAELADGAVTEGKLNTALATKINGKVDQSAYNDKVAALEKADADNLAEAKLYADGLAVNYDAAGTASGLIGGLNVTDTAVAGEYVSAVSEAGGKITVTRAALPTVDQLVIDNSTNAVSGEGVKTYVDAAISDSATEVNQGIAANTEAIAAINNEFTGILAQAKADAETKASAAETNAKTYADGLKATIDSAYAAADATTFFTSAKLTVNAWFA